MISTSENADDNNNNNNEIMHFVSSLRLSQIIRKQNGADAAIDRAFDELDLKSDGQLGRSDIAHFMKAAANLIRMELESDIIECAVDALLDDVGGDYTTSSSSTVASSSRCITREQFRNIFQRHPEMMRVFDDEMTMASLRQSVRDRDNDELTKAEEAKENSQVWEHAYTHWKNGRVALVWLAAYGAANIVAFTYKGILYKDNEEAIAVFGNCIIIARGCAQCLNLNACLILIPMCRHLLTRTRAVGKVRFWFPFDATLEFHMLVGIVMAVFASTHVLAHICDFSRFADADEQDIVALFGDALGPIPESKGQRWWLLIKQPAGITGIIMVICMAIAYATILRRRKNFNTFWITHHLLLVMLVALCFHGMGSLLEPFQSVYWVAGPFILYLIPRIIRETNCSKCKVIDVSLKGGNVVALKLVKPASWNTSVKAGMYAFINVPKVSSYQWHPFTLTSAPHEDFIEFHFCQVGDWTTGVHDLLEKITTDISIRFKDQANNLNVPTVQDLVVKVEGPIGASSQGFSDYPILVLVGAGIGVTPMISVLKQLLWEPGKMKRTFLYWTVRDRASFDWFCTLMDEIYESDQKHVLQIRHFLTSIKDDERDIGAILLHHATRAKHMRTDFDIVLGHRAHHQVEVGRPDWVEELASIRTESKELGHNKCGIFLCGPAKMAQDIADVSFNLSVEDPSFNFHFSKETF